ncbi:MAG: hypothetical protein A4E25_01435 [Methanobacterium sp. PtaB.Bin024]|nr:MAG: hypothetical protein A4E25_01435 [Methanobacterium sp. PtaB.Bin024]
MARPSKLTPELVDEIVKHIKAGNYPETAAEIAGISSTTFYRWKKYGKERKTGKFREFWESIKKAESFAEGLRVQTILKASEDGNWQAAGWWLERKFPDRWGRRQEIKMEHSGSIKKTVHFNQEAQNKILEEEGYDES